MNKEKFIKELERVTRLDYDKCTMVNSILEDYFLIGKNNKEKIVYDLINKLNVTNEEAENIYDSAISIIGSEMKEKFKHPFKNQN